MFDNCFEDFQDKFVYFVIFFLVSFFLYLSFFYGWSDKRNLKIGDFVLRVLELMLIDILSVVCCEN